MTPAGKYSSSPSSTGSVVAGIQALRGLSGAVDEFREAIADRLEVSKTETIAVVLLCSHGPMTARELATRLGLTPSSVTSVMDRLEAAGLAARHRNKADRRAILVEVTPWGREVFCWSQTVMSQAMSQIDVDRLAATARTMAELAVTISGSAGELKGFPDR